MKIRTLTAVNSKKARGITDLTPSGYTFVTRHNSFGFLFSFPSQFDFPFHNRSVLWENSLQHYVSVWRRTFELCDSHMPMNFVWINKPFVLLLQNISQSLRHTYLLLIKFSSMLGQGQMYGNPSELIVRGKQPSFIFTPVWVSVRHTYSYILVNHKKTISSRQGINWLEKIV